MSKRGVIAFALVLLIVGSGCSMAVSILRRNVMGLFHAPAPPPRTIERPVRPDARLAVSWIGHATTMIQIDDKMILTDPVFTRTVGQLSPRLVAPGIDPNDLPPIDVAVISHMHFDHLSLGSLDLIEPKLRQLLVPRGGLVYVPDYSFATDEVGRYETFSSGALRVTAVPVLHPGFRYGVDADWMTETATGWVFEYHGITVYFGGDTAYDGQAFRATAARFPKIDLAILPIAPIEPANFMRRTHIDGREALQAFVDLGAIHMLPIHYDTFPQGMDPPGHAVKLLREAMGERGIGEDRIHILSIGGQIILIHGWK